MGVYLAFIRREFYMLKADDSSFCGIGLLGFAIRVNALTAIHAEDNQRDQGEGLAAPIPVP